MYCVYLTTYSGNKLPPFYIGSTSLSKIDKGYLGSVSSTMYHNTWRYEIKHNRHMFKNKIIKIFASRKEATEFEIKIHAMFNVMHNPLYINMKNAVPFQYKGGSIKNKISVHKNGKSIYIMKQELNLYISLGYKKGSYFSEEGKKRISESLKDTYWINNNETQKRIKGSDIPEGWKIGRLPDSDETKSNKSKSKSGKPNFATKNKILVKDSFGNHLMVNKTDPRYLNKELIPINSGKKDLANHLNKPIFTCEHCGITTTKGNYSRWHGKNCKLNHDQDILQQ